MGARYPEYLLRGLRKQDFLKDGKISTDAFVPDKRTASDRTDGLLETSVDWEDDGEALQNMMARRQTAEFGVARLARASVDRVAGSDSMAPGDLSYERRPVDGNPRHGNLLFRALAPYRRRMMASALALEAVHVPRAKPSARTDQG